MTMLMESASRPHFIIPPTVQRRALEGLVNLKVPLVRVNVCLQTYISLSTLRLTGHCQGYEPAYSCWDRPQTPMTPNDE